MNGLELARGYYEAFGKPMLEEQFAHLVPYLAVGLVGSGSECLGYDDAVSRDHDFEPGFCLFLPGEDIVSRRDAFLLERAYAKLPKEYGGVSRTVMQPVGGARHGVLRIDEFVEERTGTPDGELTLGQWLSIPFAIYAIWLLFRSLEQGKQAKKPAHLQRSDFHPLDFPQLPFP